ncbi:DUF4157 domain-containing protein [uncultured Aquimarina sp.]|uniref:eCIS core domain-containing protein n=1 Tax=uncultured Aquimarina sp. TaxID=575652 RepID=UPI002636C4D1|nr:DUF4157 domain-containing protein [uncultured Aquimarina sp.]
MKTQTDKTQESQNSITPRVASESSNGGTAQLMDNRTSTIDQRKLRSGMDSSENTEVPIQRKTNNNGLPDNLKSGIENLSGYSMDDVKVHYNSSKPTQLQAHAYAQGTDIHLAPGQEKHLPHEAWHVVQQKQGRVKPTRQLKSKVNINDDVGLEKEADVMGSLALKEKASAIHSNSEVPTNGNVVKKETVNINKVTQRKTFWDYLYMRSDEKIRRLGTWQRHNKYIKHALGGGVSKANNRANVRKTPDVSRRDLGSLHRNDQNYLQRFRIISKETFDNKCNDIADELVTLSQAHSYVCVVSNNSDKSNFWLTAKILKMVKSKGGDGPANILSTSTREVAQGERRNLQTPANTGNSVPNGAKVVFIDDASYSGSQLKNLTDKFVHLGSTNFRIGLVAISNKAKRIIGLNDQKYLGNPIAIDEFIGTNQADKAMQEERQRRQPTPKEGFAHGNFTTGLYYKVPDFASVRNELLTSAIPGTNLTPITGYTEGDEHYKQRNLSTIKDQQMRQNLIAV